MRWLYVLILILALTFNGCSSLGCTLFSGAHPYCGTRSIVHFVTIPFNGATFPGDYLGWFFFSLLLSVDLAPTIAMDTILLPFTCSSDYQGLQGTPYLAK